METQKEEAISKYIEHRREESKKCFQNQVGLVLTEITSLSCRLKDAKERLLALKYKEPEDLDI